jgi:glycosyltransferase involved in cell wall biosynthesis
MVGFSKTNAIGMTTISVIITTFNGSKNISNTLRAILQQEGINKSFQLEIIAIDDCSTDNTLEILKKHPIRIFSTETNSGGPNKGRNIGLAHATGEYICIVDQDDLWHTNRISSVLPYIQKAPIISSGYTLIDTSTGKTIERVAQSKESFVLFEKNSTFLSKLTRSSQGQNTYLGSLLFHRSLRNILFEEHFGKIDYDWVLRLFHQQTSIEICSSLYTRIVDGTNLSLNPTYRRQDFYYSLYFIEQFENLYPTQTRIARKKIHGSRARYYYIMNDMRKARLYFRLAGFSFKNILYYCTTFAGSSFVKKQFNVFG